MAVLASSAYAQGTCAGYTNDVIRPAYTCVASTVTGASFGTSGGLLIAGAGVSQRNLYATNTPIDVGALASRKTYTNAGIAISPRGWDSASGANNTVSMTEVALFLDGSSAGTNAYAGAGAGYGGGVWLQNFTMDVANANNGDMNGLMAGVAYNDKNPNGVGLTNYVHVAKNYSFTAVKADMANTNPTTGIRAIQNNDGAYRCGFSPCNPAPTGLGPQALVRIDQTYTANITSGYGVGVYVSGKFDSASPMPTVNLNNTAITLVGSGNALKVGKRDRTFGQTWISRVRDGWGAGQLNFAAGSTVAIDTTAADGEAIALAYGESVLDASQATAFNVNSRGTSIRVGNDILTNSLQPSTQPITGKLNNAVLRTQTANADLIQVDPQQQSVVFSFTGASTDLAAPSNGYVINVLDDAQPIDSAVNASFGGGKVAGLANKAPATTLNLALSGTTWTLVEKSNGDKTSTYSQFDMSAGSTLNAYKSGVAAFVMQGPVTSAASTIALVDAEADDLLTINGNYTASAGAVLTVDTCLATDTAPSDVLKVDGSTAGATTLRVSPVVSASCPGALTTGNGILVVEVTGASAGTFSLDGGTVQQGNFVYSLVQVGKNWYLQSRAGTGSLNLDVQVNGSAGTPAFSGNIAYSVSCAPPSNTYTGTIAVAANAGSTTVTGIPAGSNCTVTQTNPLPVPPSGYAWGPVSYTQPAAITINATQTATIVLPLQAAAASDGLHAVPVNHPWALAGLSALLALTSALHRRRRKLHVPPHH